MKAAFDLRLWHGADHRPTTNRDYGSLSRIGLLRRTGLDQRTMCDPARTSRAKIDPRSGREYPLAADTVPKESAALLRRPRRSIRQRQTSVSKPLPAQRLFQ